MIRLFIVGFPRSGTTLAQQLFSAKYSLFTSKETHYYMDNYVSVFDKFLSPIPSDKLLMKRSHSLKGSDAKKRQNIMLEISGGEYFSSFCELFDAQARRNNFNGWVEKTPSHIRRVALINEEINDAKFVHVVRDFDSVLMSWNKVTLGGSKVFDKSEKKIFRNWKRDIQRTFFWINEAPSNHAFITYSDLCKASDDVSKRISCFLECDPSDHGRSFTDANLVVDEEEYWKSNNFNRDIILQDVTVAAGKFSKEASLLYDELLRCK